ncbi:glycosyltransferase family 39 protein, partial [Candidatus Curtissbacteria bacterium]|nr:glycosyltransferase family 39 protein [Candidatus Curtissbacteria bacterium]
PLKLRGGRGRYGLLAAFLLTLSPWHFFISRPALEANLSLTFILAGAYFLVKGIKNSTKYWLLSAVSWSLSLHTYNTARVFVPLLIIAFFLIYRPKVNLKQIIIPSLVLASTFVIIIFQITSGTGTARYQKLAILSESAVFQIGEKRQTSTLPPLMARLIHNRPVYFATQFGKNYLSYFSPQFLYQTTGVQSQFAIPVKNLFALPVLVLALLGLIISLPRLKDKPYIFLYAWLLLSPVAAASTIDPPQALRPNPMIPAIIIFAAIGFTWITNPFKKPVKTVIVIGLLALVIISFGRYLDSYWNKYRLNYSPAWQYGYKEAINYIKEHEKEYKNIFVTKRLGEPHIFYAFYSNLDPNKLFPGENNIRFKQSDWFWTDKIGKIYFVNDWDIPNNQPADFLHLESGGKIPTQKTLLITSPDHIPANAIVEKTINYLDGSKAFIIVKLP